MKKTGEILRKSREEKGLSVHEVALSLKINPRILQAIEEGEQSALPAKTFLRGFVQSYAKFLKLDPQEVLRLFSEEMTPTVPAPPVMLEKSAGEDTTDVIELDEAPEEKPVRSEPADAFKDSVLTKTQNQNDALKARTIAISIIGLLLVIIVYFVNSVVKKYQREAEIAPEVAATIQGADSTAPAVSLPAVAQGDKDSTQAANLPDTPDKEKPGTASPTAATPTPTATPTPPPVAVKPPVAAPTTTPPTAAPVATPKPVPTPAVTATPAVKPVTPPAAPAVKPPTPTTAATTAPAATPPPAPAPPTGKLTEVIIEATENVEIEYSSAKSRPQKLVLKPDQIHTFKSRSGVKLKISNGGGVNVIVNGQDRGAPGAVGQPVQVSYE